MKQDKVIVPVLRSPAEGGPIRVSREHFIFGQRKSVSRGTPLWLLENTTSDHFRL